MSEAISATLNSEQIEQLKQQHGPELRMLQSEGGPIVLRPAHKLEYNKFIKDIASDKMDKPTALRELTLACSVYPDGKSVIALLDKYPALPLKAVDAISSMAGAGEDAVKL